MYLQIMAALLGYALVFLCLIHNIYFGNSFDLFTKSSLHFVFTDIFNEYNYTEIETNKFFTQILKWNPLYNIHRLIILVIVCFYIYAKRQSLFTYAIFASMISQHIVLLLTHPDSRYAYLAWLLTLILFFKVMLETKIFEKLNLKN